MVYHQRSGSHQKGEVVLMYHQKGSLAGPNGGGIFKGLIDKRKNRHVEKNMHGCYVPTPMSPALSTALLTNYCAPYHLPRSVPTTALCTSYRTPDQLPRCRYIDYIKQAYLSTSCSSSLSMNYHRLHYIII
jgi:hypothetical protein